MSQDGLSSSSTDLPNTGCRRVRLPVLRAEGGDHAAIDCFLRSVFHGPPLAEFQASLDDPFYEPRDRLLLRLRRQIVAHVQIAHRTMLFGPARIPAATLAWLGVASEQRGRGFGAHLLREAERQMRADGALLAMIRTSIPGFFSRRGWVICGQSSCRRANAFAVLARLRDHGLIPRRRHGFHIRPWLQWEEAALARIYAASTAYGPLERTDAYWQWLLRRHGHDRLYVALEGPELLELREVSTHVVGYAVTRGDHIVELMTAPDRSRVAAELLARCCGDAVENDQHCVALHGPPSCLLFKIFDEANASASPQTSDHGEGTVPIFVSAKMGLSPLAMGQPPLAQKSKQAHGEVCMMRLLDPPELLRRLSGLFDRRAAKARLPRPSDLGLMVEGQKYQLDFREDGVRVDTQHAGRTYLRLNPADFTRLLLGQLDWDAALADGRLECSTTPARLSGRALFPPLPFWRPPWDDLPAQ